MHFDARAAKQLKAGEHIVVDGCPGLRLVATTSRRSWVYRYKDPATGLMKQIKMGSWPNMPPAEAAAKWQGLRDRRDTGEDLRASHKASRRALAPEAAYTLGQMVEHYAAGYLYRRRQAKGAKAVHQRLEKAIKEHADLPVSEVNRRFAFDLIEGLSDRPVMAASVKTELGAAWVYGMDAGRIPEDLPNWWLLVHARKLRSKGALRDGKHKGTGKRVLSETEIKTLLASDLARFSQQVKDFLTIQLWTCTRGAEIVCMRGEHITKEADGWWWTVPKEFTKGRNNERATDLRVPLEGRALVVVERLLERGPGWLFPSVSRVGVLGHQEQAYMQSKVHYLQPYCKAKKEHVRERLTVTHWSPHDLRRTGRTLLAAMGCPNEIGEAILGHVQPGVVGVYNLHAYNAERRLWLGKLSERLESLA
ncbi:MAG: integrase family protein [Pseudomonadota bacterium]